MKKLKKKTHKGTAKTIKLRKGGTTSRGMSARNHNTGKKGSKAARHARKGSEVSASDAKRLKDLV